MGKQKKGRSVKRNIQAQNAEPEELLQAPHSFVIHRGLPGGHVLELTKDFRKVMEPYTASSLKERKRNTIKDFVSIAGIFHVSHLCMFSRTELGIYLKLARLPRGPTLTFRVHNFSLSRDVISSLKKQMVFEDTFKHSPLIVLNNFSGEGMQMKLMTSTFQNMFPAINLTAVKLNTVRRCVMMNYNSTTKLIDFRHYVIKVIPVGVSKGVKKVIQGKVPDLSRCNDIAEFLTKSGILSESEAEDDKNSHVTLPQKLSTRGNIQDSKSAIRLSEVGPRMTFQLIKVEDGLLDGEVLFHELIQKTEEEAKAVRKRREQKKKLKEKRQKVQQENTENKQKRQEAMKEKSLQGMRKNGEKPAKGKSESDILMRRAAKESVSIVEDDDAQYYRDEVGEEPDRDLFAGSRSGTKRPYQSENPKYQNKKFKPNMETTTTNKSYSNPRFPSKSGNKKFNSSSDARPHTTGKFKSKTNSFKTKGFKKTAHDKTNSDRRDKRPIGGGKSQAKPGGRGGHPKYGFKAQQENEREDKFHGNKKSPFKGGKKTKTGRKK